MFLDIALGLVAVQLVVAITDTHATTHLYLFGIAAALLPDLDAIWHYFKTKEVAAYADSPSDHREGLHYPLIFIPGGTLAVWIFAGTEWGAVFFFASTFHFLHDSFGTGWGIKWLWPFSNKNYKFFCRKDNRPSSQLLISWEPDELRQAIVEHGDPEWIQNLFIRPILSGNITKEIAALLLLELIFPMIVIGYIWFF